MSAKHFQFKPSSSSQGYQGEQKDFKKARTDKYDHFCDHCKLRGHTKDTCFKL